MNKVIQSTIDIVNNTKGKNFIIITPNTYVKELIEHLPQCVVINVLNKVEFTTLGIENDKDNFETQIIRCQ